jgi:hypothetical protein
MVIASVLIASEIWLGSSRLEPSLDSTQAQPERLRPATPGGKNRRNSESSSPQISCGTVQCQREIRFRRAWLEALAIANPRIQESRLGGAAALPKPGRRWTGRAILCLTNHGPRHGVSGTVFADAANSRMTLEKWG